MKVTNFLENDDVSVLSEAGPFKVIEWKRDVSVSYELAQAEWFASQMNVRRRQLVCEVDASHSIVTQAGAMQWSIGNIQATTGLKGVGDFLGKIARGSVTNESAIKPEYQGEGLLVLEPTYRHLLLIRPEDFGGDITVNDGLFYACETSIQHKAQPVKSASALLAGGEGLFNLALKGTGVVALESPAPECELVTVELTGDELKVDGNFAIAWSTDLNFTVERSSKTLIGSAASGEGLLNVYRGHGKVLLAPLAFVGANKDTGTGTK